jgi:hypothetical protein
MSKKKKPKLSVAPVSHPGNKTAVTAKTNTGKSQLHLFSKKFLLLSGIFFLTVIILYSDSFKHGYTYDDAAVVAQNRFVQKGWAGIGDILRTQYFAGYDANTNAMAYRPVPLISLAIETAWFGNDAGTHHAINIFLYALTVIFLFYFLLRLFYNYHFSLAFIIAFLFAVHPIHTEVVANIKSRDELLGFFNFIVSMIFLLKYLDKPSISKILVSIIFYFLALASKESLLPTLAVIPLLLYFFRSLPWRKILLISIPFAIVFVIFLLIRQSVIGTDHGSSPITYLDNPLLAAENFTKRAGTTIALMGQYLQSLIFPYQLACDYSYNSIPLVSITNLKVMLYVLVYLALLFLSFTGFRKKSIWSFCILYFFITISIVSSILILSSNAYADRFLYTPSLSVCMALGFWLYRLPGHNAIQSNKNFFSLTGKNSIPFVLFIFITGLSSYKIKEYVPVWKDDLSLFNYNLKINPQNARMLKNLGSEYVIRAVNSSDTIEKKILAEKGIPLLEKGLAIYPNQPTGWVQLGNAWFILHDYTKAEENLRKALKIDPADRFANGTLGSIYYMTGRYTEAAAIWEKIDPALRNSNDNYNLSIVYQVLGNPEKAAYYKKLSGR